MVKISCAYTGGVVVAMLAIFGITVGLLVNGWTESTHQLWNEVSREILSSVQTQIDDHLQTLIFASKNVPYRVQPDEDPQALLDYFAAYDTQSGYRYGSMGYLTRATGTTNGKYSWQIAKYAPSCPTFYGYFFANASIYNEFHGYCTVGTTSIDYSNITYNGFDWGLKPEEAQLVDGNITQTFLPLFVLLGQTTITHEYDRGGGYVSFAELDLGTLTSYVQQNVSVWGGRGVVIIIDNASGNTIATNAPGASLATVINSGWYVAGPTRTQYVGLDWSTYVAVPSIYEDTRAPIVVACVVSAAVVLAIVAATLLVSIMCVARPIERLSKRARGEMVHQEREEFFDDFK